MQRIFLLCTALAMSCNSSQQTISKYHALSSTAPDERTYAATITEEELREHLYTYASDAFEGRETGTPGQKKAVDYLESAYKSMGIAPARADEGYQQPVPLEWSKPPKGTVGKGGLAIQNGEGFVTFVPGTTSLQEVVYVGHGIETEEYSDYEGLDVRGKYLLMKAGEPRNEDGTFVVSGTNRESDWSDQSEGVSKREEVVKAKGAKGFFYVDDANYPRYKRYFDRLGRRSSQMRLAAGEDRPQMILTSSVLARELFPELNEGTPRGPLPAEISISLEKNNTAIDTENVVAFIPGTTRADEYLVISSHLDHIGIAEDGDINNGADDDGSGTVAMLEIAEAFQEAAQAGNGPKRSVVFLHVTGEENGLLGSRYYTDFDPVFPLDQTVANLNIDMIGRTDPKREGRRNYIYLIGSDKLSTELHRLSEDVNEKFTQIELDYRYNDKNDPNRFYYRSDHYNFAKNNIPIIFYFNGTHVDYHRPGDTPDKIDYDLLTNRTRLIFHTAWEIANREARLKVDKATR